MNYLYAYSRMSVTHEMFSIFTEAWQGLCYDAQTFKDQIIVFLFHLYHGDSEIAYGIPHTTECNPLYTLGWRPVNAGECKF
jgi:hypothetical protein